jgi:hypothetical protein
MPSPIFLMVSPAARGTRPTADNYITLDGEVAAFGGASFVAGPLDLTVDGEVAAFGGSASVLGSNLTIDGEVAAFGGSASVLGSNLTIDGGVAAFGGSAEVEFVVSGHRYWRVGADDDNGGGGLSVAEIGMLVGGVDQTSGGTPFATSRWNAGLIANAFDNNTGTLAHFTSFGTFNGPTEYIGYDFGAGNEKDIDTVTWNVTGVSPVNQRSPRRIRVEWSDDFSAWTGVYASPSDLTWTTNETKTFTGW